MVPSGTPRRPAISDWVRPPKNASSIESVADGQPARPSTPRFDQRIGDSSETGHLPLDLHGCDLLDTISRGLLAPYPVDRSAPGDRQDPTEGAALRGVVSGRRAPEFEHHPLGHFLALGGVSNQPADETEHGRHDQVVQVGEGSAVTPGDGRQNGLEPGVLRTP